MRPAGVRRALQGRRCLCLWRRARRLHGWRSRTSLRGGPRCTPNCTRTHCTPRLHAQTARTLHAHCTHTARTLTLTSASAHPHHHPHHHPRQVGAVLAEVCEQGVEEACEALTHRSMYSHGKHSRSKYRHHEISSRGPYTRAARSSAAFGARLLCLLRPLVAALGGSALAGRKVAPVGALPLPRVLERAAPKVTFPAASDRPGARMRTAPLSTPACYSAIYHPQA